ncbi:MAG: HAD family hydrolase [Faecousia sp.]
MRVPCLVLDHDDTVVNSTATVHFPCFQEFLKLYFPQCNYTLEEYFLKNFSPGILELLRDEVGMDDEMLQQEHRFWDAYVQQHVPQCYEGMRELLWKHKEAGGLICVVSQSFAKNILRDYRENGLPEPDLVFGWEYPAHQRKPKPYPLQQILLKTGLKREELLVVDDLKPGYDMAKACGIKFAAAGWAYDIPRIEAFMRENCDLYFKTVAELAEYLEG